MSRSKHLIIFTLLLAKNISRQHSLLRKRCFTEYISWVLMKQSCCGIPFNLITETEKSSKKHHEVSTIFVIRLFCIKTFSSSVFLSFIHNFRRLYPKKLWIQPERATRKSRTISMRCYNPSSSFMPAIYFRALRISVAIPFCGRREFRVCGILSRYLHYSAVTFLNRLLE